MKKTACLALYIFICVSSYASEPLPISKNELNAFPAEKTASLAIYISDNDKTAASTPETALSRLEKNGYKTLMKSCPYIFRYERSTEHGREKGFIACDSGLNTLCAVVHEEQEGESVKPEIIYSSLGLIFMGFDCAYAGPDRSLMHDYLVYALDPGAKPWLAFSAELSMIMGSGAVVTFAHMTNEYRGSLRILKAWSSKYPVLKVTRIIRTSADPLDYIAARSSGTGLLFYRVEEKWHYKGREYTLVKSSRKQHRPSGTENIFN